LSGVSCDDRLVQLPHDEVGAGPAVLLLHAGIADRTMWAEHLSPIAVAGYRVIAVDLPGFGEAPLVDQDAPWNDVVDTLDALSVDRCVVVGNSFGGAVALRVAVVAPSRVAALMLISAPPPDLAPSSELRAAWEAEESALERGDIDAAVDAVVVAWTLPDASAALREHVAVMQRRAFELQRADAGRVEGDDPIEGAEALATVQTPALVAVGELDMIDFRSGAETIARQLPHARHAVITAAGHLAPLEQPEEFRRLLLMFLAEHAT
jgi:pimeloyl-ACP methyl ester carboxylesterase